MRRLFGLLIAVIFLLPGCIVVNFPGVQPMVEKTVEGKGESKIVLMEVSGIISDDQTTNIFGVETKASLTASMKEQLELAAADKNVKGIILRINTPGGAVTTCDIINHEIKNLKKKRGDIAVVSELMDVAASGGYYIAASTDKIIAHPTTVTGSIGVIAYNLNASGLLDKIGIADQTIKSGAKKDIGSPLRPMTEDERKILQSVINGMYERFLDVIVDGRKIEKEELRKIADGRIYTAGQALNLKLIDGIGYLDDSIELVKKQAGIKEAKVVTYAQPKAYKNNIYSSIEPRLPASLSMINIDTGLSKKFGMSFMYLWEP